MELTINVDALDKTAAAVTSASDRTPVSEIELLVVDNVIPLTLSFCDDSGAVPSWVTDVTAEVAVGLGNQTVNGDKVFSSSTVFSIVGSTRTGTLSLNTDALRSALLDSVVCQRGDRNIFILEIRYTTAAGLVQTVGLLTVFVAKNVLPADATNNAGDTTQNANLVFAGPASGSAAAPTFRALVTADLPNTAVTPGSYTYTALTVDAKGRITAASSGAPPTGTVTAVTATAPVASTGGTTPVISMAAASAGVDGYLSSTDWTTFNNKQASGNYITDLTGDVTASGPGSVSSTVTKINGTLLSGLATGILKNTTGTGTPSIAIAGTDFPSYPQILARAFCHA